ncbi:MAG: peptidase M36, partial [Chitinophagaceae bacterium]
LYQYRFIVTDNGGSTASDTMQVMVVPAGGNLAPTANAGADIVIMLPLNTTALSGSGADADGSIVAFNWSQISGPSTGSLSNATSAIATAAPLVQGVYTYELRVTDDDGATAKDTMQVTVNPANNIAPTATAGNDIVITLPINTATLNGSGIDPDGTIASYAWVKISGPAAGSLVNATEAVATISSLGQGIYQYQLTVMDNSGAIGRDTIQVTVNAAPNLAPVANAGANISITLPTNTSTLNGSATDADGTIISYAWTKVAGPAAGTIATPAAAITNLSGLVQGTYQFRLSVSDNAGATASDTVQITVNAAPNLPPVANAGNNISITLPTNTAILAGSGTDIDGNIAGYAWIKIAGPAAGSISNPTAATATATGVVVGVYQYQLTV